MNDQTTTTSFEEAPASWNTRYITPDGFTCQLTLRGETGIELLKKAQAAMVWLREQGCQPHYSGGYWSNSNNGSQSQNEPTSISNNGSSDPAWCSVHNVTMKRRERNGQVWYSHKAPDGSWCNGKNGK